MNEALLFDFNKNTNAKEWRIIDDTVMGGRSYGKFKMDADGNGVFFGDVSTANNGGFSSVRYQMNRKAISNYTKVAIRLKGDGKNYQFRIKDKYNNYYSYITTFKTTGEWQTIDIKLSDLYPSFRGRKLDLQNFNSNAVAKSYNSKYEMFSSNVIMPQTKCFFSAVLDYIFNSTRKITFHLTAF